jgi:predicted nuclease with TOPRIM domain
MRIVKILRNEITELKAKNVELTKSDLKNFDKLSDIQELFNALGLSEISVFVDVDKETIKKAKEIIEANYKKQREELKASGIATQQSYSDAKLTKDKNVEIINSYSKNKKNLDIEIK